jgi:hypothetical protein
MQSFISLLESDFVPISAFSLKWRWTDPKFAVLPKPTLGQVRPLSESKAKELWNIMPPLLDQTQAYFFATPFESFQSRRTSGDPEAVRQWLFQQLPPTTSDLILSWQPSEAVLTTRNIFCQYWDDFCYPGRDDVTIWSVTDEWAGLYWHEEELYIGKRKPTPFGSWNSAAGPTRNRRGQRRN